MNVIPTSPAPCGALRSHSAAARASPLPTPPPRGGSAPACRLGLAARGGACMRGQAPSNSPKGSGSGFGTPLRGGRRKPRADNPRINLRPDMGKERVDGAERPSTLIQVWSSVLAVASIPHSVNESAQIRFAEHAAPWSPIAALTRLPARVEREVAVLENIQRVARHRIGVSFPNS